MTVLSHRGYWLQASEKNTAVAFERSFSRGFGTETDLRDLRGALVISHDPPQGGEIPADDFLDVHQRLGPALPLALNIKSDGLQRLVADAIARHRTADCFVFDMSVPDALGYLRAGVPAFTRHSELEPEPAFYKDAAGVWLDSFFGDWLTGETLDRHLDAGKRVCVVSPELHKRAHQPMWERLAAAPASRRPGVMLCTDFPEQAEAFFDV